MLRLHMHIRRDNAERNKRQISCLNGRKSNNVNFYCMFNSHEITRLKQIVTAKFSHFETDINGLVTRELTSGTLTPVCRNSTVFTAQSSSDNLHQKIQTLTCTTLIWRLTSCFWLIGCTKMPLKDTPVVWLWIQVKIPSRCWSTVKVSSVIQTPVSWQTHRWRYSQWQPADATDSAWSTLSHQCALLRSQLKVMAWL